MNKLDVATLALFPIILYLKMNHYANITKSCFSSGRSKNDHLFFIRGKRKRQKILKKEKMRKR